MRIIKTVVLTNSLLIICFFAPVLLLLGKIAYYIDGDKAFLNVANILFLSGSLALIGRINIQKRPKKSGILIVISGVILLARFSITPDPLSLFFGISFMLSGLLLIFFK